MNIALAIGAGGAVGSVLRYALTSAVVRVAGTAFPYGTLLVNVLGSFTIGLLYVWLMERTGARPDVRAFLIVGVLGGFTTFSSFSLETMTLLMQSSYVRAVLNILASVGLCIGATMLGIMLARQF
jgi:fluoride exporter